MAVITLGDTRKAFYLQREHIVKAETALLTDFLQTSFSLFVPDPIFSAAEAQCIADEISSKHIACVIIHLPIWGTPSLATKIAYATTLPVILIGNTRPDSSSMVAFLATAGMLEQGGKEVIRVLGDLHDESMKNTLMSSIKASTMIQSLRRSNFCLVGGQSIGIGTTVADPAQWMNLWNIDYDHADQYEVVYRAEAMNEQRVQKHLAWLRENLESLQFGNLFTEKSLEHQVRSYLALKDMVEEQKYDFIALKCQRELSDHYAVQCLSIALLNNPYDADGPKPVIPCSCEGDCDGALTMQILHMCDVTQPSCLVDIRHYDQKTKEFTFANCGGMAFAYAALGDSKKAMGQSRMMSHVFGEAGGGTTQLMAQMGCMTAARLFRKDGSYHMGFFRGDVQPRTRESLVANSCYPHAFIQADIDFDRFVQTMGSNHMHFIYGDYCDILELFCQMQGIPYYNYTN